MSLATDGFSAITNDFISFISPHALWSLLDYAPGFTYYSMKKALRPEKGQSLFPSKCSFIFLCFLFLLRTFSADLITYPTDRFHQITG